MNSTGCFINGRWIDTKDRLPVRLPLVRGGGGRGLPGRGRGVGSGHHCGPGGRRTLPVLLQSGAPQSAGKADRRGPGQAGGTGPNHQARGRQAHHLCPGRDGAGRDHALPGRGRSGPDRRRGPAPGPGRGHQRALGPHPAFSPGAGAGHHPLQLSLQPGGPQGGPGPGRGQPHHPEAALQDAPHRLEAGGDLCAGRAARRGPASPAQHHGAHRKGGGRRPPQGPVLHRQRRGGLAPEEFSRPQTRHPGVGRQRRLHRGCRRRPAVRRPPGRHRRLRPRRPDLYRGAAPPGAPGGL